jgi:hypothetical protein
MSKLQTHPLVREGGPQQESLNYQTENKYLVTGSRWDSETKIEWRLTVGRNLTSTSTSTHDVKEQTSATLSIPIKKSIYFEGT